VRAHSAVPGPKKKQVTERKNGLKKNSRMTKSARDRDLCKDPMPKKGQLKEKGEGGKSWGSPEGNLPKKVDSRNETGSFTKKRTKRGTKEKKKKRWPLTK